MPEADSDKIAAALAIVHEAMARIEALSLSPGDAGLSLRAAAGRLRSERRRRDAHFPPGLFGEPAWDLLLALFAAGEEGQLPLPEAFEKAGIDARAGAEAIGGLEREGLVARGGPEGGTVRLTERAVERLSDYLARIL